VTTLSSSVLASVLAAMREAGVRSSGPLRAEVITGGRSNLTYVITDGVTRWVLRTPPRSGRTASAHDVSREYRVTKALEDSGVPVPAAVLVCEDESLLGTPFTISQFVDGVAVRTRADLAAYSDRELRRVIDSLLQTLAVLHRVDHVEIGLESFGRPTRYAERQLRRWTTQWGVVGDVRLDSLATEVADILVSQAPNQRVASIVHGDYRIDNTLLAPPDSPLAGAVTAVVDWELSTIGDPVADVAMMCAYRHESFDLVMGVPSAWTSPRMPGIDDLAAGYEQAGGVPLEHWPFHQALAYFKVAVIAAGIEHRRRAGSGSGVGFDTAGHAVEPYLELALTASRDQ
jgi:aminoglycoside phosphotransferase (APT) family kinase protein